MQRRNTLKTAHKKRNTFREKENGWLTSNWKLSNKNTKKTPNSHSFCFLPLEIYRIYVLFQRFVWFNETTRIAVGSVPKFPRYFDQDAVLLVGTNSKIKANENQESGLWKTVSGKTELWERKERRRKSPELNIQLLAQSIEPWFQCPKK